MAKKKKGFIETPKGSKLVNTKLVSSVSKGKKGRIIIHSFNIEVAGVTKGQVFRKQTTNGKDKAETVFYGSNTDDGKDTIDKYLRANKLPKIQK